MSDFISTGAVSHVTLTVTNLQRSLSFYRDLLGFETVMPLGPTRMLLSNGSTILAVGEAPDPSRALADDHFDENRVGLDHLSLRVNSRSDLERAVKIFDEDGISHGEIKDLGADLGMYVLAFRDPDNIQLELTAMYE